MSQAVATPTTHNANLHNVNFARTVRSEYIKFTSLRSSWILLLVTAVILVGIAALMAWGAIQTAGTRNAIPPQVLHTVTSAGLEFGQLVLASVGAIFIGGEYSTGMIRSTMTAVPNRWGPICAKALLLIVIGFVVGAVSGIIAYFVAQPILAGQGLDFPFTAHGVVGSTFGFALYMALATLLGMSIGLLLRNSAGGIVVVLALLLVVPIIFAAIPLDVLQDIAPYLPSEAGQQMTQISTAGDKLNQWQGGLIGAAWAAVLLGAGLVLTKIRDV
jgi:ABC-type transport system involved in multi-copper enzyme maturation permease subunit